MKNVDTSGDADDRFDLSRFISAQEKIYGSALAELRIGKKRTHWMWFVFPQLDGLGQSAMAQRYAIKSIEEARLYLHHPVLGARLLECAGALLAVKGLSAAEIMGFPDDLKLKSCMTLFASVADSESIFTQILDEYFGGEMDVSTLSIIGKLRR